MSTKATKEFASAYRMKIDELEHTREKVEKLCDTGTLSHKDVEQVYAGLFLSAFTEFESLIEELFLGIVSGTHVSSISTTKRLVEISPATETRKIVFNGKLYLDWIPLEDTIKRATLYLNNKEPFSRLNKAHEKTVANLHILRNAVAHKSEKSKRQFEGIISGLSLLPEEKSPTGYLRTKPYGPTGLNQYQISVAELRSIADILCN